MPLHRLCRLALACALALGASSAQTLAVPITSPADPALVGAEAITMPTGPLPRSTPTIGFGELTYAGNFSVGIIAIGATSGAPGQVLDISWTGGSATAVAFDLVNIDVAATLQVFDTADQIIETHPTPFGSSPNTFFFGAAAADIGSVRITAGDSMAVANLLLVPDPGTGVLALLGLAGLGRCRLRRPSSRIAGEASHSIRLLG